MPQAVRKKFDENSHFLIEKDVIAKKVVRFIVSCKRCKKQKVFAGEPTTVHHLCCDRSVEFQPSAGKLPVPEQTEPLKPPPAAEEKA
ncbi:MAG: hypothetical protein HY814_14075 [Candidatus Riflebacteria bacterium]|nr:hypothetical protein [Candidatus Riflebacteria bacterium]